MANNSDLDNAEKRRDSRAVFDFFQGKISQNEAGLRSVQEVATGPRFRMVNRAGVSFTELNTEQTLISETIQANVLQTSNIVEFEVIGTAFNASGAADNVTYRVKYGGSAVTLGPLSLPSNTQRRMFRILVWLYGSGTPSLQKLLAKIELTDVAGSFGAAIVSAFASSDLTVDSTTDQAFVFSIQHATALPSIGSALLLYKLGAPITAS